MIKKMCEGIIEFLYLIGATLITILILPIIFIVAFFDL